MLDAGLRFARAVRPAARTVSARPKVTLISCGGTIASAVQPGVGAMPSLDVGELARSVPGVAETADLTSKPMRLIASPHMTLRDLLDLASASRGALAAGAAGVVITQGTDTIEEIAFGLDLLCDAEAPIVVTGAMRNASMAGADGPANVLAAVRVAASPLARGLGTLVVFNDEIHAARFVRKSHAQNPATFVSHQSGRIGWLAEADVRILMKPARRYHVRIDDGVRVPAVALLKMALGDDGRLIEYLPAAGFSGCVIEGFGGGHVTREIASPGRLERLIDAIPVVLASRAGSGELLRATYEFEGSEMDLIRRGVIYAGALDGPKARVLLALLVMAGADREEIARTFADIGPLSA